MSLGWQEHIDKTGTPCAYCEKPLTQTLIVEPDQYSNGELRRRGIRVGVCDDHVPVVSEDVSQAVTFRRRGIKGVEQLSIDTDDLPTRRRGGAIGGNEAA